MTFEKFSRTVTFDIYDDATSALHKREMAAVRY